MPSHVTDRQPQSVPVTHALLDQPSAAPAAPDESSAARLESVDQAALRASQARLAAIMEIAEDAIIAVDQAFRIIGFNRGAEHIFGYTAREALGQPLDILIPPRFREAHRGHMRVFAAAPESARRMGERREIYGLRRDGSEFPAEASIAKLIEPSGITFTAILRDITARKRAADELERQVQRRTAHLNALLQFSKELLRARSLDAVLQFALHESLALAPDADRGVIYLYEPDGDRLALRATAGWSGMPRLHVPKDGGIVGLAFTSRRTQVAHSAAELIALAPELTRQDAPRLLLHEFEVSKLPSGVIAIPLLAHDRAIGVLVLIRATGAGPFAQESRSTLEGLANLVAIAILEEQSRHTAASLIDQVADLEAQRRAMAAQLDSVEAGMLQAARLAAVGQLAAAVAHEINNPLYAARNGLLLLAEDLPDDLRDSPYLTMASEQLARIARIIERMRDFYRPDRGELAEHDLNQLLEETLALAGLNMRHGTIRMIFAPAHDLPPVLCNADQLRQVFLNLVLNAIEAMPDGGTLTVRTTVRPAVAVVEIEDTGIGIPREHRARLFEPFFTSKRTGTGLGLSISAHIVTQHGGRIEVESEPGQGSTFRVILPYALPA